MHKVTAPDQMMATMFSDDVPEQDWHPDDAENIRKMMEEVRNTTGESCAVKRRPDGTLTILSAPVSVGLDDDLDTDLDNDKIFQVGFSDELNAVINDGVIIALNDKDSEMRDNFGDFTRMDTPALILRCKEDLSPILKARYQAEGIEYSAESFEEELWDFVSCYEFYVKANYDNSIEGVLTKFSQHCFFPPDFVWIKGKVVDVFENHLFTLD